MGNNLKVGSEKTNDRTWRTFVYVTNATLFKRCRLEVRGEIAGSGRIGRISKIGSIHANMLNRIPKHILSCIASCHVFALFVGYSIILHMVTATTTIAKTLNIKDTFPS